MKNLFLALFAIILLATSCKDDEMMFDYTVPTTYNFENVSYSGQTSRLAMLTEWRAYMATSREEGGVIDAARMKAMFENSEGAMFSQEYSKQIKSKTFEPVVSDFEELIDQLATTSEITTVAEPHTAGRLATADGTSTYLMDARGIDHAQVIEKGLMGACFYYQIAEVYTGDDRMDVDNETIEPGEGTAMEHHWDEAFGYFGVPIDFPTTTDGLFFWGKYSNTVNGVLGTNQKIMDQYLKGRAAITNDDLTARDEARVAVRAELEMAVVGAAIHYLNEVLANWDDYAKRQHALSEAIGFIYSLQFNPDKKVDNEAIKAYLALLGNNGNSDITTMDVATIQETLVKTVKTTMAIDYGLTAVADEL